MVLFENGEAIAKHKGGRSLNELLDFIKENMNEEDKPQQHQQPEEEASKSEEKKDGEEEDGENGEGQRVWLTVGIYEKSGEVSKFNM